ncbi:MAG: YicC/YloC family endoribonuclease [Verrucomicrobiota bacterium]
MRSMTGHGRGEGCRDGLRAVAELRCVNRRQAEVLIHLPEAWAALEGRARDMVAALVSRGRCEARLQWQAPGSGAPSRVNRSVALAYATQLRALSEALGRPEDPGLDVLIRCPGVLEPCGAATDPDEAWPVMEEALRSALGALDAMRRREGEALERDLRARIGLLREEASVIRGRAPEVMRRYRDNLVQRVRAAGIEGAGPGDERILKELVVFADRSDISEEIARLESHFVQFEDACRASEAAGRRLDFLAQEMHREINTIGSKANDAVISASVVRAKTELERFREQVQNVE